MANGPVLIAGDGGAPGDGFDPSKLNVPPNGGLVACDVAAWQELCQMGVEVGPTRERWNGKDQVVERMFLVDWRRRKEWVNRMIGYTISEANMIPDPNNPGGQVLIILDEEASQAVVRTIFNDLFDVIRAADPTLGPNAVELIVRNTVDAITAGGTTTEIADRVDNAVRFAALASDSAQGNAMSLAVLQQLVNPNTFKFGKPLVRQPGLIQSATYKWRLRRVLPAQDPEYGYEHLYCSEVEMQDGRGIMGPDPAGGFYARNPDGSIITVNGTAFFFGDDQKVEEIKVSPTRFALRIPKMSYLWDGRENDLRAELVTQKLPCSPGYGLALYKATFTPRKYHLIADTDLDLANVNVERELRRYVERAASPAIQGIPRPRYTTSGRASPDPYPAITESPDIGLLEMLFGGAKAGARFRPVPGIFTELGARIAAIIPPGSQDADNLLWRAGPMKGTNNGLEQAGLILIQTEELRYRWMEVPDLPHEAWRTCEGKVNSGQFDGWSSDAYDPGTLLMQAPKCEAYRTVTGRWYFEILYSFLYRPDGWNNLPCGFDGKFYPVSYLNGESLYKTADFDTLFRPVQPRFYQTGL